MGKLKQIKQMICQTNTNGKTNDVFCSWESYSRIMTILHITNLDGDSSGPDSPSSSYIQMSSRQI